MDGTFRGFSGIDEFLMLRGPTVRELGLREYTPVWQAMRSFTESRSPDTRDELWVVEHHPVFTLGQSGDKSHVLEVVDIPIVESDRGGQVTYHGPGQLIIYVLVDIVRSGIGVRPLVRILEQAVIDLLACVAVDAQRITNAPGVYVNGRKIAALGIRVKRGRCYHGLSINVDMDLTPFQLINPCGYPGLEVTQLADLGVGWAVGEVARRLLQELTLQL